jgi:hypothetical protein
MSNNSYDLEAPPVPFDYGLEIKEGLFERLYRPQLEYWNKRLRQFSERNVAAYAREDEDFNMDDQSFVAIFYEGETFNLLPLDEDDDPRSPYCLELCENKPGLAEEMAIIAGEIRKLRRERYEAQRFLAGFMLFDPPPEKLEQILGDGLFRICHTILSKKKWTHLSWDLREPEAFQTFVTEQQSIITAMQERMLLNMITI